MEHGNTGNPTRKHQKTPETHLETPKNTGNPPGNTKKHRKPTRKHQKTPEMAPETPHKNPEI